MKRTVYGVGYNSKILGIPASINRKATDAYITWKGMIQRCYYNQAHKSHPSYINCLVCDEWHDYQNFAKWFSEHYVDKWNLDKDILSKGVKLYSPDTCLFVPRYINNVFIDNNKRRGNYPRGVTFNEKYKKTPYRVQFRKYGVSKKYGGYPDQDTAFEVYKKEKKKYIIELANEYRSQIGEEAYNNLINFEIIKW